jgi:hypothetical protein
MTMTPFVTGLIIYAYVAVSSTAVLVQFAGAEWGHALAISLNAINAWALVVSGLIHAVDLIIKHRAAKKEVQNENAV